MHRTRAIKSQLIQLMNFESNLLNDGNTPLCDESKMRIIFIFQI